MIVTRPLTDVQNRSLLAITLAAIGVLIVPMSSAQAVTLKVSVTNLGPPGGTGLTPVWFGFHDGSFDLFDEGEAGLPALELLAEEGFSGLETVLPEYIEAAANSPFADPMFDFDFGEFIGDRPTIADAFTGDVQGLLFDSALGLFPGETGNSIVQINPADIANNRFFSYGTMVFPTNDGFIANDGLIEIFDADGNFIGTDFVVLGSDAWDAGTEVNTEALPDVPFNPFFLGNGTAENGVVQRFPGFTSTNDPDNNLFTITPLFENADFTVPGYQVARITITVVPEPSSILGLVMLSGGLLMGYHKRRAH